MIFLFLKERGVIKSMINFLNQNDRENISKICDMDFSLIENKISNLSNFGNEKHVVTDMDIFGFHLVRT